MSLILLLRNEDVVGRGVSFSSSEGNISAIGNRTVSRTTLISLLKKNNIDFASEKQKRDKLEAELDLKLAKDRTKKEINAFLKANGRKGAAKEVADHLKDEKGFRLLDGNMKWLAKTAYKRTENMAKLFGNGGKGDVKGADGEVEYYKEVQKLLYR